METPNSLRILCLDGGGIKGYTSLLILRRIFRTIAAEAGLKEPPRPCDIFDLIAGTSTGGLIAVMLGRLHMSVEEAIAVYGALGKEVFGKRLIGGQFGRIVKGLTNSPFYDIEALQAQVQRVLKSKNVPMDELFLESDSPTCKVILCATRIATSKADVFRNYESHHPTSENYTCRIWEAASATAAAPMFFRGVKFQATNEAWCDGGLRRNNPINEALAEISREPEWQCRQIGCILSLGTGMARSTAISSNLASFLKGSIKIMTDAEDTAKVFAASAVGSDLARTHRYFRFNVPQGMEDLRLDEWKATERMRALTTEYLSHASIGDAIQICAKTLAFPDENVQRMIKPKKSIVPFQPCTHFISRPAYTDRLRRFFAPNMSYRQIFALWGLAGVGKTQIALEFAQSMKQRHSVFWVRADTLTNFIADYSQIMGMLDSDDTQPAQNGSAPSLLEMIRNKLEELSEDWVLILDNADHLDGFLGTGKEEKSISIAQYIPRRGRILITTRDRRFQGSIAAAKDGMCVELMSGQEAESLLLKSVPEHLVQQNLANAFMISELVEELGYLPLAIAQAAANIVDQQLSFAEYVRLFQEKKRRLQLMKSPAFDFANRDPRNGIQSVHVTWEISIDVLRAHAPRPLVFLRYLACYHWRDVPQMVVKALPEFKELDVAEFLKTAKRPLGLSLIEQTDDETGGMTTYSMHPLLHELLLKDVNLEDRRQYLDRTIALMSNIFPFELEKGGKKWALATFLSPHAARHVELAQDAECKSQSLALLMLRLSSLYGQSAMLKAGAEISVRSVKMASELWDAKSLTTFYFRKNNQIRLNDSARYPEAEEEAAVLFKLLEAPEIANYLGESTVEEQRIDIQTTFAVTLRGLRSSRFGELETLHRSQLQSGHLDPWSSQGIVARHNLAHALLKQGRFEEAMAVNTELLAFCETENGIRLVGKPLHLIMLNLRALIFRSDGSLEANKEEVVEIYKRVFRESQEHLGIKEVDTWLATNNVCGILLQLNREGEMGPILWEAIPRAIAAKIKTEGKFDQCVMEVYHKAIQYLESVPSKHGGNCKETIEFKELLETWKFTARLYDASIDPSQQMDALNNIGVFRQYNGKYDEAEKFHIQAIELCELHNQTQGLPLFRYNQMLAIARAGRTVEAEAYRRRYLDLILLEEANYGSLESRMKEFEEDRSLYQQAKEMVVQGTLMKESQWYQVNIKSIGRAERRYGELFS